MRYDWLRPTWVRLSWILLWSSENMLPIIGIARGPGGKLPDLRFLIWSAVKMKINKKISRLFKSHPIHDPAELKIQCILHTRAQSRRTVFLCSVKCLPQAAILLPASFFPVSVGKKNEAGLLGSAHWNEYSVQPRSPLVLHNTKL